MPVVTATRLEASPQIDAWYKAARAAGALGGKLCGAGSGGHLLFYVPPGKQAAVEAALPLERIMFEFESEGAAAVVSRDHGNSVDVGSGSSGTHGCPALDKIA